MTKHLLLYFSLIFLFSCNNQQEIKKTDNASTQDTLAPIQVTVIEGLPDSLQPKTIALDTMPKPLTVAVPNKAGGSYSNAKGEVNKINLLPPETKPALPPAEYFTNFNTDQGLALSSIVCGYKDKTGNLWFGTTGGGVSRYDGKSFVNFTSSQGLANNNILCITEDKTGNLWFGTQGGGISRYDGKSFANFTTSQGLANNSVMSITEDKTGNLWFGTTGGVSRYDGNSFVNFTTSQGLANNYVRSISEDKTGNLWFGTSDGGGVSRYDGKSFVNFTTSQGLANNNILCITEDKTGNLWFGTFDGGVSRYDGKSFVNFTTAQGLANNTVFSITVDKTGNLWFGTEGGGVSRYDGKSFVNFTTSKGLANNTVYSITEDKTGNLWFGTFGGGVSRYDGKSFVNFTTSQGLATNDVLSIMEDKTGNLWFGTSDGGVSRYDGKSFVNFTTSQGLANNLVYSIAEDKTGNLWFGTKGGGVSRYDGKSFVNFTTSQGLANNTVNSIAEDKTGNLWFGTEDGGVSRYDGKSFVNFTTSQGLANNTVPSITADKTGNLWFGTWGGGVSRYDGKSFVNFTTSQGLANNTVLSITEDKTGNLWFGTLGGGVSRLSVVDLEKLQEKNENIKFKDNLFVNITTAEGLADNNVYGIVETPDGNMVFGTNLGFSVLLGANKNFENGKYKWEYYNNKTGYPVKDINGGNNNHGAMCVQQIGLPFGNKTDIGVIWAGCGDEKIIRFDPKAVHKNTEPPAVFIQAVKVNDETISYYNLNNEKDSTVRTQQEIMTYGKLLTKEVRDSITKKYSNIKFDGITKWYPLPENLVLPHKHNSVTFDFLAIETNRNFLVRYQYILEGNDNDWSPITEKTSATFGNIFEGTYTFKLKARSPEGVWSEPVTYTFKVLPPWYRTWWAYAIYALLFLFSLRAFVKWRERNLRMEKEKLEHTVEIRTAEVVAEKKKSDDLLLNILPEEVAEELKAKGSADAKQFNEVTVMFTDFKGFTQISEKLTPEELVAEIHTCFKAFDNIIEKHNIEKIKTIGDAYMCAGGLPVTNTTNAVDVVNAAIEIQQFMQQHLQQRQKENKPLFEIRIGIHTGPVVAGIVGVKKFAYDIWGDTVNVASRMESSGEAGKVNISGSTYELVKDKFKCEHRGKIQAKNKGEIDMYFIESV